MRRTLRQPSCERKGGMSFECGVIHPPMRNGAANWCSGHSRNILVSVAAHESGNNGEDTKFLYLAVADFCTQRSVGRQTGSITPDKCLRLKGHSASCGHSRAGVRFKVNFKGEF
jgi:hypothetical protein